MPAARNIFTEAFSAGATYSDDVPVFSGPPIFMRNTTEEGGTSEWVEASDLASHLSEEDLQRAVREMEELRQEIRAGFWRREEHEEEEREEDPVLKELALKYADKNLNC